MKEMEQRELFLLSKEYEMDLTPSVPHTTKFCLRSYLRCNSHNNKHFSIESTLCTILFWGVFLPRIKGSYEQYAHYYEKDVDVGLPDG